MCRCTDDHETELCFTSMEKIQEMAEEIAERSFCKFCRTWFFKKIHIFVNIYMDVCMNYILRMRANKRNDPLPPRSARRDQAAHQRRGFTGDLRACQHCRWFSYYSCPPASLWSWIPWDVQPPLERQIYSRFGLMPPLIPPIPSSSSFSILLFWGRQSVVPEFQNLRRRFYNLKSIKSSSVAWCSWLPSATMCLRFPRRRTTLPLHL